MEFHTPRLMIASSDNAFRLKAYKEYVERSLQRWNSVSEAMAASALEFNPEIEGGMVMDEVESPVDTEIARVITFLNESFPDMSSVALPIQNAYVNGKDMIDALVRKEATQIYGQIGDAVNDSVELIGYTANGTATTVQTTFAEVSEVVHSGISTSSGLLAGLTAKIDAINGIDIAGALASAKQEFSVPDIESYIEPYVSLVKNKCSESEFFGSIQTLMGLPSFDNDQSDDELVTSFEAASLVGSFTGVNPGNVVLAGTGAFGPVGTVVRVGLTAVKSIATTLFKVGSRLFAKGKEYVQQTFDNPYELEIINGNGYGSIDGYLFGSRGVSVAVDPDNISQERLYDFMYEWNGLPLGSRSLTTELIFGHFSGAASRVHLNPRADYPFQEVVTSFEGVSEGEVNFVLRPVNPSVVIEESNRFTNSSGTFASYADMASFYEALSARQAEVLSVKGLTERDMAIGFTMSWFLAYIAWSVDGRLIKGETYEAIGSAYKVGPHAWDWSVVPATVTNQHFFRLGCGYQSGSTRLSLPWNPTSITAGQYFDSLAGQFIRGFMFNRIVEHTYPLTEAPFVPYVTGIYSAPAGTYRIRTDAEILQAAQSFMDAVVLAVTAVAASLVLKTAIRKISNSVALKQKQRYQQALNKLTLGGKLNRKDKRMLIKYSSAGQIASAMSSGFSTTVNKVVEVAQASSATGSSVNSFDTIVGYIIGTPD